MITNFTKSGVVLTHLMSEITVFDLIDEEVVVLLFVRI
jgi:hypothetical protein